VSETDLPELGPLLGRMSSPAPRGPAALPLDDVRWTLLTGLYGRAGLARRELAAGRADTARSQLAHEVWLALWQDAARAAADLVQAELARRFAASAAESRIPPARLAAFRPTAEDRSTILARIQAAGIPLEQAAPPAGTDVPWRPALLRTAMALDASWERLEAVVVDELRAWDAELLAVRTWRRPLAPLWVATGVTAGLALALGLSLGGYLPAPGPLATLRQWWWSLPWR
jgi:hypothetical protein